MAYNASVIQLSIAVRLQPTALKKKQISFSTIAKSNQKDKRCLFGFKKWLKSFRNFCYLQSVKTRLQWISSLVKKWLQSHKLSTN